MTIMTQRWVAAMVSLGLVLSGLGTARAGAATGEPQVRFNGVCRTAGPVTITPGLGFVPQEAAHHYEGTGVCSGALNDARSSGIPVRYVGGAPSGLHSCEANASFDGPAQIVFFPDSPQEVRLDVHQTTAGAGALYTPLIRGSHRGAALGVLQIPVTPDLIATCVANGFATATITIDFVTLGTLVG